MRVWAWLLGCALPLGCAADVPAGARTSFDASTGVVEIVVLGDGFVRTEGRRLPLEAVVLTLRQRTRAMSKEDRHRLVVQLDAARSEVDDDTKARIAADLDRLLGELQIMGVTQVRYL